MRIVSITRITRTAGLGRTHPSQTEASALPPACFRSSVSVALRRPAPREATRAARPAEAETKAEAKAEAEADHSTRLCDPGKRDPSHLRIGLALAAIAVAVYALMWVGYRRHWLTGFDAMLRPLHDYGARHHGWVSFWNVFCTLLGPTGFRLVGAVVIVIAQLKRNLRAALFLAATILLSGYVTYVAKALAHRLRPQQALVHAAFNSFPSGHAVAVMVAVLALLTVSAHHHVQVVLGALVVISVGVGRVVLNVHYPSDVLAGWALGYLWFFVCLVAVRPRPLTAPKPDLVLTDAATGGKPEAAR